MGDPWFGRKGDGYTGGPLNLKGWVAIVILPLAAFASYKLLPPPANILGAGALLVVLVFLMATKYDRDTESW